MALFTASRDHSLELKKCTLYGSRWTILALTNVKTDHTIVLWRWIFDLKGKSNRIKRKRVVLRCASKVSVTSIHSEQLKKKLFLLRTKDHYGGHSKD